MFKWLMNYSLNGATSEWLIEDFRKIALALSKNINDPSV
jgi:hypothetical protein